MADVNTAAELVAAPAAPVEQQFHIDVQTIVDLVKIPLERAFEVQVKEAAAGLKAAKRKVEELRAAREAAFAATDDPAVEARKAAFAKAIGSIRRKVAELADGSGLEVKPGDAALDAYRVDEEAGTRTFAIKAIVPFAACKGGEGEPEFGVKGIGAELRASFVEPLTDAQVEARKAHEEAAAACAELNAAFADLIKEKEEVLRDHERLAKNQYARMALGSTTFGQKAVDEIYNGTYAANLLKDVKHLDRARLAESGLLPPGMSPSLEAPAPKAAKKAK